MKMIKRIVAMFVATIIFMNARKTLATEYITEAQIPQEYMNYCREIGQAYNIQPELLMAIIERESMGNPNAVGADGDTGLMQIIPRYHKDRMKRLGVSSLYNARGNILVGTDYLAELFQKYGDIATVLQVYNGTKANEAIWRDTNWQITDYAESIINRSHELEMLHYVGY